MTRTPLSFGALQVALAEGDSLAVVELFSGRSEAERRAVAPELIGFYRDRFGAAGTAMVAALLGAATFSELCKLGGPRTLPWYYGIEAYAVLTERNPPWVEKWVSFILERPGAVGSERPWGFCRRLVRNGFCPRPQCDFYILAMTEGLWQCGPRRSLRQVLLHDAGLLEHELWRLFEVEGRPSLNLTTRGQGWEVTLAELGDEGIISRERLLDCALCALERDFKPYYALWYEQLLEQLDPTLAERVARSEQYLRLLDSAVPATVEMALEVVTTLEDAGLLAAEGLVRHLPAALESAPKKKTALAALVLLERVIVRAPEVRTRGLQAACAAFGQRRVDVQKAALELVARHFQAGDRQVQTELLGWAETIAASLRARLEQLIGLDLAPTLRDSQTSQASRAELERRADDLPATLRSLAGVDEALRALAGDDPAPALRFAVSDVPLLGSANAIVPVADHEELVELLSALVENSSDVDDVERALDGVARLCGSAPEGFSRLAGPLRKRALALLNSSGGRPEPPRRDVCEIVVAWLADKPWGAGSMLGPYALLSERARVVAYLARRGEVRPLLSVPTHAGGWIDPGAMPARLAALKGGGAYEADVLLMILRLAPHGREAALSELRGQDGLALLIRAALGETDIQIVASPRQQAAVSVARATVMPAEADEEADARFFADPGQGAWFDRARPLDPVEMRQASVHWRFRAPLIRWVASVWPSRRETFFAAGIEHCRGRLDFSDDVDEGAFIEPLLDSDQPLGRAATHMLLLGLASRDQARQSMAVDVLVAIAADGRLDPPAMGPALWSHAGEGLNRARLARALEAAAGTSVLHAQAIRLTLEHALPRDASDRPRDLHALLGLLLELASDAQAGITHADARAYLEALNPSSKAGGHGRDLLALPPTRGRHVEAAALAALEWRLQRAERWAANAKH